MPLVAIGGISHANAREVIEAGADSVAVISALLSDPARITDATRALHPVASTVRANIIFLRLSLLCARISAGFGRLNPFERPYLPAVTHQKHIPCGVAD